jgi:hypothetical protein
VNGVINKVTVASLNGATPLALNKKILGKEFRALHIFISKLLSIMNISLWISITVSAKLELIPY